MADLEPQAKLEALVRDFLKRSKDAAVAANNSSAVFVGNPQLAETMIEAIAATDGAMDAIANPDIKIPTAPDAVYDRTTADFIKLHLPQAWQSFLRDKPEQARASSAPEIEDTIIGTAAIDPETPPVVTDPLAELSARAGTPTSVPPPLPANAMAGQTTGDASATAATGLGSDEGRSDTRTPEEILRAYLANPANHQGISPTVLNAPAQQALIAQALQRLANDPSLNIDFNDPTAIHHFLTDTAASADLSASVDPLTDAAATTAGPGGPAATERDSDTPPDFTDIDTPVRPITGVPLANRAQNNGAVDEDDADVTAEGTPVGTTFETVPSLLTNLFGEMNRDMLGSNFKKFLPMDANAVRTLTFIQPSYLEDPGFYKVLNEKYETERDADGSAMGNMRFDEWLHEKRQSPEGTQMLQQAFLQYSPLFGPESNMAKYMIKQDRITGRAKIIYETKDGDKITDNGKSISCKLKQGDKFDSQNAKDIMVVLFAGLPNLTTQDGRPAEHIVNLKTTMSARLLSLFGNTVDELMIMNALEQAEKTGHMNNITLRMNNGAPMEQINPADISQAVLAQFPSGLIEKYNSRKTLELGATVEQAANAAERTPPAEQDADPDLSADVTSRARQGTTARQGRAVPRPQPGA